MASGQGSHWLIKSPTFLSVCNLPPLRYIAAKPECSAELEDYFDINRLSLNVQKCKFMLIGSHQSITKMADSKFIYQ